MTKVRFQDAGEICESCRPFWEAQDLAAKYMVHVFNDEGVELRTDQRDIPIVICPHCDGDVILRLRKVV